MSDIVLSLSKATKLYAGVPAIDGVDFDLRRGEIPGLLAHPAPHRRHVGEKAEMAEGGVLRG